MDDGECDPHDRLDELKKKLSRLNNMWSNMTPEWVSVEVRIDDAVIDLDGVSDVLRPVWSLSLQNCKVAEYDSSLAQITAPQRWLYSLQLYEIEVCNGGHQQYFWNSSGNRWNEAYQGLLELNLLSVAAVLSDATDLLGGHPPVDCAERRQLLQQLDPDFESLDMTYYKLKREFDLKETMMSFIRQRRKDFYFSGFVPMTKYEAEKYREN